MANANRHKYYDTLNLIGYGLSKFGRAFVEVFGFSSKSAFYRYIVSIGIAATEGTVKNRQDLFDGMVEGGTRKGWWQKGDMYKHRKDYIDSLFGELDVSNFVDIVKLSIADALGDATFAPVVRPIIRSRYKQLQETGLEAENYFANNYTLVSNFDGGVLDDARLFGDGYDFQITTADNLYLVEVKGLQGPRGSIRLTQNEYNKAQEYTSQFALSVVSNLTEAPRMAVIYDPVHVLALERRVMTSEQVNYHSPIQFWT